MSIKNLSNGPCSPNTYGSMLQVPSSHELNHCTYSSGLDKLWAELQVYEIVGPPADLNLRMDKSVDC